MLALEGGAKNLMDANIIYNIASWKPDVSYSVSNRVGDLQVHQPSSEGSSLTGEMFAMIGIFGSTMKFL